MKNDYLIVPLNLDLTITETLILSQLAFLKRLYSTITVSNDYIANKLCISNKTVSRAILSLSNNNYIIVSYQKKGIKSSRTIRLTKKSDNIYDLNLYKKPKSVDQKNDLLKKFLNEGVKI